MAARIEENTALADLHLTIAGKLIVNAANADLLLYCAFKVISGCDGKIANAIYFATETIHTKRTIVNRLLMVNGDKVETKIVGRILDGTEKATNQRNDLSHSLIMSRGNQLLRVNPRHQGRAEKPITKPYLTGLLKMSAQGHLDAFRAYLELCSKRGIPPTITHE